MFPSRIQGMNLAAYLLVYISKKEILTPGSVTSTPVINYVTTTYVITIFAFFVSILLILYYYCHYYFCSHLTSSATITPATMLLLLLLLLPMYTCVSARCYCCT